ncbi:MAG: hypothetical protein AB8G22_00335 [Saprospiraceae bacterium]
MKKTFTSRLAAIDWIADFAENESQFERLREQLHMNFIYTETYFLEIRERNDTDRMVSRDV